MIYLYLAKKTGGNPGKSKPANPAKAKTEILNNFRLPAGVLLTIANHFCLLFFLTSNK